MSLPWQRNKSGKDDSVGSSSSSFACATNLDVVAEQFAKKLLGNSEIESILRRLDRLTLEEARMTEAQILEVVHGLMNNMKIVMDGE